MTPNIIPVRFLITVPPDKRTAQVVIGRAGMSESFIWLAVEVLIDERFYFALTTPGSISTILVCPSESSSDNENSTLFEIKIRIGNAHSKFSDTGLVSYHFDATPLNIPQGNSILPILRACAHSSNVFVKYYNGDYPSVLDQAAQEQNNKKRGLFADMFE